MELPKVQMPEIVDTKTQKWKTTFLEMKDIHFYMLVLINFLFIPKYNCKLWHFKPIMTFKIKLYLIGASSRYVNITDYKLKKTAFGGYDSWIRPVLNMNTTTNISFDLTLSQILEIVIWNFLNSILTFEFWLNAILLD